MAVTAACGTAAEDSAAPRTTPGPSPSSASAGSETWRATLAQAAQSAEADASRCPFPGSEELVRGELTDPVSSVGVDRGGDAVAVTCDWGRPGSIELSLLVDGIGDLGEYDGHAVLAEREHDGLRISVSAADGGRVPVPVADELVELVIERMSE